MYNAFKKIVNAFKSSSGVIMNSVLFLTELHLCFWYLENICNLGPGNHLLITFDAKYLMTKNSDKNSGKCKNIKLIFFF